MEDLKYVLIEEINESNICYHNHHECFKCKRSISFCCPRCFDNYYILDDETNGPVCRFNLFKKYIADHITILSKSNVCGITYLYNSLNVSGVLNYQFL